MSTVVPRLGRIHTLPRLCDVGGGILRAVERGVSPGGMAGCSATLLGTSISDPGGKVPPSTAGRMPAACSLDIFGQAAAVFGLPAGAETRLIPALVVR